MNSLSYTFTLYKSTQRLLRSWQIQRENAAISQNQTQHSQNASLMCLPDDILLLILDHLWTGICARHKNHCDNPSHYGLNDYINLTMCNQRLRHLAAAPQLFRTIHLGRSWSVKHTMDSLSTLSTSELALRSVKELKVDLWVGTEQKIPASHLPQLGEMLAHAIVKMENLEKLSFSTTVICAEPLKQAFLDSGLEFPQIRELKLGYNVEWLIQFCPGVETVASDDWLVDPRHDSRGVAFVKAAGKAPVLKNFSFHARWDASLLKEVWVVMPQLQSLGLDGGCYITDLDSLLAVIKHFGRLQRLRLTDHEQLIVGCTRVFPQALKRTDISPYQTAVVKAVFKTVPGLKELAIGKHFRAWMVRRPLDGGMELKWEANIPTGPVSWEQHDYPFAERMRISSQLEDVCTLGRDDEEILSDLDDGQSVFSRTDTLAW